MIRMFRVTAAAAALFTLAACADAPATAPDLDLAASANRAPAKTSQSIGAIAIAAATEKDESKRQFTQLVAALQFVDGREKTQLVELFLNGRDQYTVFAPTDEAFGNLLALAGGLLGTTFTSVEQLPPALVRDVLLYHVTTGRRAANSVLPRNGVRTIQTLKGESFAVTTTGSIRDGLTPLEARTDATIRTANISASNGIVHVIDQVILPPSAVKTLLELARQAQAR